MAEIDFRTTSLADLARSVRAKEVSARELTQAALSRIERLDPTYNAFVSVDGERALAFRGGRPVWPLGDYTTAALGIIPRGSHQLDGQHQSLHGR